jgi:hypothetical protein
MAPRMAPGRSRRRTQRTPARCGSAARACRPAAEPRAHPRRASAQRRFASAPARSSSRPTVARPRARPRLEPQPRRRPRAARRFGRPPVPGLHPLPDQPDRPREVRHRAGPLAGRHLGPICTSSGRQTTSSSGRCTGTWREPRHLPHLHLYTVRPAGHFVTPRQSLESTVQWCIDRPRPGAAAPGGRGAGSPDRLLFVGRCQASATGRP